MGKIKERWQKIKVFFQEVKKETKQVTWPSKTELFSYTLAVLIAVFLMGVILGIEDKFISTILSLVIR
ncbi:preprotein translocase subunit SecE [Candidatus Sumerlaeota bacterium]|nr:preprotein translocase subunit SecE [Candidatus Sumerlaeota bacterium]